jgi:AraC family transcriptional regulator
MRNHEFLHLLRDLRRSLDGDMTLTALARRAGKSRFHFHRHFLKTVGATPKALIADLRLEQAAANLVGSTDPVIEIALAAGYASHEVFTRAFRRRFGCTPQRYRADVFARTSPATRARHMALVKAIGPCIHLFQLPFRTRDRKPTMPLLSISRQERAEQPILLIRRRLSPGELQSVLAQSFGKLYAHGQAAALPIAGWPLARYLSTGPGLWTVEAAMPLATPARAEGEMEPGLLPGGPVALGIHAGPYDQLPETNAAIEQWIEANGFHVGGAPWESYVTDPGEHPDPADWRTQVYWPLAG